VTAAGALPFGLGETCGGVVEPAGAFGGLPLFWVGPAGGPALGGAAGGSVAFGFRDWTLVFNRSTSSCKSCLPAPSLMDCTVLLTSAS
jgi:hypothetical protein